MPDLVDAGEDLLEKLLARRIAARWIALGGDIAEKDGAGFPRQAFDAARRSGLGIEHRPEDPGHFVPVAEQQRDPLDPVVLGRVAQQLPCSRVQVDHGDGAVAADQVERCAKVRDVYIDIDVVVRVIA